MVYRPSDFTDNMGNYIARRNNVQIYGAGTKTILFAHGFGCDQNMWRFITPAFAQDYRLILFDYVGSGKSDLNAYSRARYSSLDGYTQDVLEICSALDLKEVIFVGHSVSSIVGILAAIESPYLWDCLILVAPSPCYINDQDYCGGFEHSDVEDMLDIMDKIT
jgi:sigma-B regulation protein RsbQ